MGFLATLGHGIGNYAKNRFMNSAIGQTIVPRYGQPHQQQTPQNPYNNGTDSVAGYPSQESDESGGQDGITPEMMATGRLVTSPTIAVLGENGPEKVIPLNANPNNKVTGLPMNPYRR